MFKMPLQVFFFLDQSRSWPDSDYEARAAAQICVGLRSLAVLV